MIDPVSTLEIPDKPDLDVESEDFDVKNELREISKVKAERFSIPKQMDHYMLVYRKEGGHWMTSCCMHTDPKYAIQEKQNYMANYDEFTLIRVSLPT